MAQGNSVAARARSLVGVRFRPQGRRLEHGLVCVGLVPLAERLPVALVPTGYRMRSEVAEEAMGLDFDGRVEPIALEEARSGDVLLVRTGPGQHHFLVLVENGFVHADARLGRVVETPGAVAWPVMAAWRMREL